MYLKKLGINGFKSFASPVQLDFTPGVSAIVGPNGSGKSNITDAIRFVLGEQSTKSMRSHRMDDIIFSGTDKARQKGTCEVTLVLSGEDGEADRIISRKLFRSGDSQYRINGKSVRLRDIQDSFRDTGLGKNGYSMVSQGGIENIVNAGPAELRAIVEEAAGIAGYKSRKAETEKKLAATRDNIERLRDILGEIEKQLKPLKGQAEKARIYFDLYEQLRTVDLLLFAQEQSIGEKEAAELEEKLKQARFSMLDAQKHAEEQDRKYLKIKQEIGTFKNGNTADEEQASVLTGRVSELEQTRVRCTADDEHAQADSRRLETEIRETESAAEQAAGNLKAIEEGCRISVRHRTELEKTGAELEEELLRYESELEELLSLQEERVSGRRSGRARKDRLTQHLVELKTQETALRVQLQTAESGLAAARAQLTDADQREQEIRSVYSRTQTALEQARKQAETVSAKAVPLREEASTVYESYQECRAAVKLTESKIDYEENLRQSYSPYNQAVKFVMKQAAERGVQGVYGPVARLIHIPARYERAIQTALGGKVQNIVVDRERTAGKMIDALKQARAGRAAFLPVDVLKIRKLSD
ncbi:MAG: chromosome segregation SMC family protein, partial [Eubacteriaceae bacterium]